MQTYMRLFNRNQGYAYDIQTIHSIDMKHKYQIKLHKNISINHMRSFLNQFVILVFMSHNAHQPC